MLLELVTDLYDVKAVVQERDDCTIFVPVLDFLRSQYATNRANVSGMKQLFVRYAAYGRIGIPTEIFHIASQKSDGIWRLSKGQLRMYGFMDGGTLVLTHGSLKKTQKTDKSDIDQAIREKNKYFRSRR